MKSQALDSIYGVLAMNLIGRALIGLHNWESLQRLVISMEKKGARNIRIALTATDKAIDGAVSRLSSAEFPKVRK